MHRASSILYHEFYVHRWMSYRLTHKDIMAYFNASLRALRFVMTEYDFKPSTLILFAGAWASWAAYKRIRPYTVHS